MTANRQSRLLWLSGHTWALLGLLTFCPPAQAQQTFSESDFDAGSFTLETVFGGSTGSSTVSQAAGGNPAPSLTVRHDLPSGSPAGGFCANWVWTFFLMTGAVVDPATSGPVDGIDFSLDSSPIASLNTNTVQSQAALVRQDGRLYVASSSVTSSTAGWSPQTEFALVETCFFEIVNQPPCDFTDALSHPDFSGQGFPIELGFARGNSTSIGGNSQNTWVEVGADNWSMTVHFSEVTSVSTGFPALESNLLIQPNPSRGSVTMLFDFPRDQRVNFELFDIAGRRVEHLGTVHTEAGRQSFTSDLNSGPGGKLPAGVYFLRATRAGFPATTKRVVRIR